ncbi:MAG: Uma2 family endonuclease, partial [Microcystaceae cyanobacterium]
VLSPSTTTFDRGDKFKFYQQLSSLQEYILIDSEKMTVDIFERGSQEHWEVRRYPESPLMVNAQESITLNSLAFSCSLASIYDEVYGISSE